MKLAIVTADDVDFRQLERPRIRSTETHVDFSPQKFQILAIAERRIVGFWTLWPRLFPWEGVVDSQVTWVQKGLRSKGVARAMWCRGIAKWSIRTIHATIVSWDGASFAAAIDVTLAANRATVETDWTFGGTDNEFHDYYHRRISELAMTALRTRPRPARAALPPASKGSAA